MKPGALYRFAVFALSVLYLLVIPSATPGAQQNDDYAKGMAAYGNGQFGEAVKFFEAADSSSPGKTDALVYAAKCNIRLQNYEAAEKDLDRFTATHAPLADAYYLLGYVLQRLNRPQDSLATYTKAARIAPPTGDDLKIVALDYELLNDNPAAIQWLERAVEMEPGNKEAWYFLGRAYYTSSRLPDAQKAFLRVLQMDPQDAKAENNMGLIYESSGKTEEALTAYRNSIQWQREKAHPSEQPYLNLGNLLLTLERTEEAVGPLQKSVELGGGNAQCHLRLGTAYLHLGHLAEAEKEFQEAVRLDPNDAVAHYQLGRYYKQVKNLDAAKAEFDRVAEIQSTTVEKLKDRAKQ
jgi:tetratricopeptide (TPR) repeat protein